MTTIVTPDPVALLRTILLEVVEDTQLAGMPIVSNVREDGQEPPFLVLAEAGSVPHPTLPLFQPARVSLTTWALTDGAAAEAYRVASSLLHRNGPFVRDDVGVFRIFDETGLQQPIKDPDTGWWRAFGVFDLHMVDRVLA